MDSATVSRDAVAALDELERRAMADGDVDSLERLWAPSLVVAVPGGALRNREEALSAVRSGRLAYDSVVRSVESVQVLGDVGVTLGSETVVARGGDGKGESRRYMHVWVEGGAGWMLVARHAAFLQEMP